MKIVKTIAFALIVSVLQLAPAVAGDELLMTADIRCVVTGMQIAGTGDSPQQARGIYMTLYYLGRVDGREKKLNTEELIVAQANSMTTADYASETKRCEAGLAEKGQQITQIGRDLAERGKTTHDQAGSKR
jgi:hypothetical protein